MLRVGARGIDVAIIVRTVAFALVGLARRVGAHDALIAHPRRGFAPQRLGSVGDAAVIDDAFLHRKLDALALAGELTLVERGKHTDRSVQSSSGVADRQPRLDRPAVGLAGDRHCATGSLGDHVESEEAFVRAILAEALHLRVDDPRVYLPHDVVAKAE